VPGWQRYTDARNPIYYSPSPLDSGPRKSAAASTGRFQPQDQGAIHERIAKIDSGADFLDWFDENYE
jgi:hypothetical protein